MSLQPDSDEQLERVGRRQGFAGSWLATIGLVLLVPGLVLMILGDGYADFAGLALAVLSAPPLLAATGLALTSAVSRWSARHRPYA